MRLWRELRERGYGGGYTAVKRTVREIRPEPVKPFEVRFETPPGEQAQVDLARFEVVFTDEPGVTRIVWLFSMVLGFSRLIWARFVVHQDLQTVLRCHIAALEAIGGAPHEILYDRMKTAVIGEDADGLVVYNRSLVDLARHYGFQPRACRPYRPKTKGKVERPFRYIREDFFLGGAFRNLDDLNAQLRHWLDTVANPRVHATTQRVVNEAFAEEKPHPQAVAARPLPGGPQARTARLPRGHGERRRQSLQRAGHHAPAHPRRPRLRRRDPHLRERRYVASHLPLEGRDQTRIDPAHRKIAAPPRRRPSEWRAHRHPPRRRPGRPPLARLLPSRRPTPRRPGRRTMSGHVEIVPSVVDRIKHTMVGLKMPRAIEILDATVRRLERGEMTALEAIDALLAEEFTLRENRRVKTALVMARLSTIKTLAGFDFSFQPSLDKNRIMALAELKFIDRAEVLHLVGPPGTGKSHLSLALGVEAVKAGRSVYFTTLADLVGALAKAEREGSSAREDPLLLPLRAAHRRRDRLPAGHSRRRQPVLPARQRPLRKGRHDPHLQPRFCRMGRGFWRPRRRHGPSGQASSPRHRHPDRGLELSPAPARRPRARAHSIKGPDPARRPSRRHPSAAAGPPKMEAVDHING